MILVARRRRGVEGEPVRGRGHHPNLEKKTGYVNHYSFHIMDPAFGHLVVKMSGHPPFGAQVILNGQYAERPAMPHRVGAGLVGEPIAPGFAA